MNKYWKLTVVFIVLILTIGAFYITSALSADQYPDFAIEKKSGNENEIDPVVIDGNYYAGSAINEGLTVTSKGSEYKNEQSFLERIDGIGAIESIRKLREEHRNFMRGKSGVPDNYYEDETYLAYGEVDYQVNMLAPEDFRFKISILNKSEGDSNSFEIEVPDSTAFDYMNVDDVQITDGKLMLVTKNMVEGNESVHVYGFDIEKGKMIDQSEIASIENLQENQSGQMIILNETDPMQAHQYVVFHKSILVDVEQPEGYYASEEVSGELVAYNLETGKTETVEVPERFQNLEQTIMFDDGTIYFVEESPKSVTISPYSLKNDTFGKEITFELQDSSGNEGSPEGLKAVAIKNGKVYAVTTILDAKQSAQVLVGSLKTGETLYKGVLKPTEQIVDVKDYSFYITDLQIK
ncbi:hypothetical protein [Virgibacillus oceani]|uniref:Uncharacterized protein n=1 Tax=Virgibacillus oceani TaxID=1479511 RepID=A0A917MAZ9_9BACI|nr:hypothetical protein [Virgibacillus oceani]GGG88768.1 hypothetical protein GCM10011398_38440 [Virgibacillus oceani]